MNKMALSYLFDKVLPRTLTEPLVNIELQFYEYIRTITEFDGGPYSGEGKRKKLGSCISDQFGNYIFRFCKSKLIYLDKSIFKIKLAKDTAFQFMPDVLIQLRHKETNALIHESVPFWNIPLLKRINISFPRKKIVGLTEYIYPDNNIEVTQPNSEIYST